MPIEVFQASFKLERRLLHDTVKAILGAVLFHRVLGNCSPSSNEICSVTLPAPSETDALIAEALDELGRARLDGSIKVRYFRSLNLACPALTQRSSSSWHSTRRPSLRRSSRSPLLAQTRRLAGSCPSPPSKTPLEGMSMIVRRMASLGKAGLSIFRLLGNKEIVPSGKRVSRSPSYRSSSY